MQQAIQLEQRVWNLQPWGGLAGEGMLPSSTMRFIFTLGSGIGIAENSALVAHIFEVIAQLAKELHLDSYRVVSNIGEQAGQSVFHLHFHVLSGRDMTWPPG